MNKHYLNNDIPAKAGIGLRFPHISEISEKKPDIGWLEIHSENYFSGGGATHHYLEKARELYPLSLHGVALSLGSVEEPNKEHLASIKKLCDRYKPGLVSEHISWNITDTTYLNDLIPLPYTEEALNVIAHNIDIMQNTLGRQILIENPSAYLQFNIENSIDEPTFIKELVKKTGCGLLLDVNNIYVSGQNMKYDPLEHLMAMPFEAVKEIHLAGHSINNIEGKDVRIDDHGSLICDDVWQLYQKALSKTGEVPTLIEWDTNIPDLETLVNEAKTAQNYLNKAGDESHAA